MPRRLWPLVGVICSLALAGAGCGSDDDEGAGSDELVGTFTRDLTEADIERTESFRKEGPGQEKPKPAPQRMEIVKRGSEAVMTVIDLEVDLSIGMGFKAADAKLDVTSYTDADQGSFCGPEIAVEASYTWRIEGSILTLKADEDPCADRDSVLSGEWQKK